MLFRGYGFDYSVRLFCFQDGWAEKTWWSKKYKDKKVKCSVDYPTSLIPIVWDWFSVTYTTQAEGEKYTWTYSCDNEIHFRSAPDSSHTCRLMDDDDSFSLPSDFDPGQLVGVDLKPGTSNAQELVCRKIFDNSNP